VSERVRKPDYFRDARRTIGLVVIVLYIIILAAVCYTLAALVLGDPAALRDAVRWTVLVVALVPLTASAVAALRNYRTDDRRQSWQLTAWSAGLFLIGILIIVVDGVVRGSNP
jgi:NADH:ubiquinone oxidoreductase subunit 6 (subunit J)